MIKYTVAKIVAKIVAKNWAIYSVCIFKIACLHLFLYLDASIHILMQAKRG